MWSSSVMRRFAVPLAVALAALGMPMAKAAAPAVTTTIPTSAGALFGVTFSPDGASAFTSGIDGSLGFVYKINTANKQVSIAIAGVGLDPRGMTVSADGTRLFVAALQSDQVDVVDTSTNAVTDHYATGNHPIDVALAGSPTRLYVSNNGSSNVSVLNAISGNLLTTIPVGSGPGAMGVSADGQRVLVPNTDKVTVIDTTGNTVVTDIPIGNATSPVAVAVSPSGTRAYVANSGSNFVSVLDIDPQSATYGTVVATITMPAIASDIALSPDGTRGFVTLPTTGEVQVIDTVSNTVVGSPITVGSLPLGVAVSPSGTSAYVANYLSSTVSAIDTGLRTVTFNNNSGTGSMGQQSSYSPAALHNATFARAGYRFAGWNTQANRTGTAYANGASYAFGDDTTMYAQWYYTLRYAGNGSTGGSPPADDTDYADVASTVATAGSLARSGYSFAGWNTAANATGTWHEPNSALTPSGDDTLWAQWYSTVTYNGGGATSGTAPTDDTALAGATVTIPGAGTLARDDGYSFAGWSDGIMTYRPGAAFTPAGNIILTAQWNPPPPPPLPPGPPTDVHAAPGNGSADVTWKAPADAGSFPVTDYRVVVSPGSQSCVTKAPALTCTVQGLRNGTTYTATVIALNGAGWGPASPETHPFTPSPAPQAWITLTKVSRTPDLPHDRIRVTGNSYGIAPGTHLTPYIRYHGQDHFTAGQATIIVLADGSFTWTRLVKKGRGISAYVAYGDTVSNTVHFPRLR